VVTNGNIVIEKTMLLGVGIADLPLEGLLEYTRRAVVEGRRVTVGHVNVHGMNFAYDLPWFRDFLNSCDVVTCDGFGIIYGARLCGKRLVHRYTHADWVPVLAKTCAANGISLYFLGGRPGVAEEAARRLGSATPGVSIVGTHHGYFDRDTNSQENLAVVERINLAVPGILVVGFGMPLQEQWVSENRERISANVVITGGGVLDYLSGRTRRGPRWMTDNGLEWLARMLIEPRRLWKRYLVGNTLFLFRVLKARLSGCAK
jgi:N-acetylglucosaminyldiphosphoundecaprenol N-acetyl-beta-D-mannosaminyltransferase